MNPTKNLIFYEKTQDSWIQDWLLTCNEQVDDLKFKEKFKFCIYVPFLVRNTKNKLRFEY